METMIYKTKSLGLPQILLNQLKAETIKIRKVENDIILSPVIYKASSLRGAASDSSLTLNRHFDLQREDKAYEQMTEERHFIDE